MMKSRLFLLPDVLRNYRLRAGMLQKTAASALGIDPSVLCGAEKGRISLLPHAAISRIPAVYLLTPSEAEDILFYAEHDRLMRALTTGPCSSSAETLSAALIAHHHLADTARGGLLKYLRRTADNAQTVARLEALGDPPFCNDQSPT